MLRAAVLLFAYYPEDVRARRESEALVEAGLTVDLFCLRGEGQPARETVAGVRVYRLGLQKKRAGKLDYVRQYLLFIAKAGAKLSLLHLREGYRVVQVHNMPDLLVLAAALPKLGGARLLLDLRDPMPELFMTKFSVPASHPFIRLLCLVERASVRFADLVITPNLAFRELFISRGCPEGKISLVMNSPPERIFPGPDPGEPSGAARSRFVVMFHGTIFERHGIDTALEAVRELVAEIPNLELRIFGEGEFGPYQEFVARNGLQGVVKYFGAVPWERISREIREIDLGIIPNKWTPFTELNFPGRIFEYLSMGKPVIVPRTRGITDYFDEESIFYFDPGECASLTAAIRRVHDDSNSVAGVVARGMEVYRQHRWELQKRNFVEGVFDLLDRGRT